MKEDCGHAHDIEALCDLGLGVSIYCNELNLAAKVTSDFLK